MRHTTGFIRTMIGAAATVALVLAAGLAPIPAHADCFSLSRLDQTGTTGWYTSLALNDTDVPHIAYWDVANGRLRFARFNVFFWSYETAAENSGRSPSLQFDANGDPHISHSRSSINGLMYTVKSSGSWITEVVDAAGDGSGETSLALLSTGFPRIAYADNATQNLRYAAKSVLGWSFQTVDTTGLTYGLGLELDGGNLPHIAYFDTQNDNLRYAKRNSSGVWSREIVESSGNVGWYPSLALDASGIPHICYSDETDGQLKYARKSGLAWAIEVVDDGVGAGGVWSSLRLDGMGLPRISYKNVITDDLIYAYKSGGMWIRCIADTTGDVGSYNSIQITSSGDTRISYCDYGLGDLMYANLAPTSVPVGGPARVALAVRPSIVGASGATIVFSQLAGAGGGVDVSEGEGAAVDAAAASLDIFDATGRRVRSFEMDAASGVERALHWDGRADGGRALAQGVYFLRLAKPGGTSATERVTLLR